MMKKLLLVGLMLLAPFALADGHGDLGLKRYDDGDERDIGQASRCDCECRGDRRLWQSLRDPDPAITLLETAGLLMGRSRIYLRGYDWIVSGILGAG